MCCKEIFGGSRPESEMDYHYIVKRRLVPYETQSAGGIRTKKLQQYKLSASLLDLTARIRDAWLSDLMALWSNGCSEDWSELATTKLKHRNGKRHS
jgi:hypothetical protein